MKPKYLPNLVLIGVLFLAACNAFAQPSTRLSADGKALQPIVLSAEASEKTKTIAATFVEYLNRISGAKFESKTGDGKSGITVGTAKDFPALGLEKEFDPADATRREDYILRSTPTGVLLIGATDMAVQHAVWDFLYRLGYRQFFPGAHWEIVPKTASIAVALNEKQKPDYYSRRIWFTYGTWPENGKRMSAWNARNRAVAGIGLNTGHAYGDIIAKNKAEFEAHPEYFSNGQFSAQGKFNIANPGLRKLVINYLLRRFEADPELDSLSVDPSDGGGWGNSPEELKIGSVSNRVTFLANEAAEAVNKKYPGKFIGFYAYNVHSPPPTIKVHPKVVVSVATAFISGGFTVDQLIDGWQKQGATIGMREYYSIIHWDKDLPYRARAAKPEYFERTLPHFYEKGARFMSAESSDNWGPNGLGYYLASRIMWDVDEAKNIPALVEDFLDKSFGPAKAPMKEYYGLLTGIGNAKARPFSADFVGRMYRALNEAYRKTNDAGIRARLDDLALYTRYVELYLNYTALSGAERQQVYEELIRFSYRIRESHMVHSMAIYRTGLRDKSVKIPPEASWKVAATDKKGQPLNPWKQAAAPTGEEIQALVRAGIENNALLDFEAQTYSEDLLPATPLNLPAGVPQPSPPLRGVQNFYVWADKPGPMTFTATAGFYYSNRGPAKAFLFDVSDNEVEDAEGEEEEGEQIAPTPLQSFEIPPDQKPLDLTFNMPRAGLYRLQVSDRMMGMRLQWPQSTRVVVKSMVGDTPRYGGRWTGVFYVPKNTKSVGGFVNGGGVIRDGDGKVVFTLRKRPEYFSVPVAPGQDGRMWSFVAANGSLGLMTVPPYMARGADELLLPRESIEADD